MQNAAPEFPTLYDELCRKTWTEIERLVRHRDSGKISQAQFKSSIDTVWGVCAGLVEDGFSEVIRECRATMSDVTKEIYMHRTQPKLVVFELNHEQAQIMLTTMEYLNGVWTRKDQPFGFSETPNPSLAALNKLIQLTSFLQSGENYHKV